MTAETKEIPNYGWWPDDDHAPTTQLYRMRGRNVAQIINQGAGWRAFSMVEMNQSKTTGLALALSSYTRSEAKTICEVYAHGLYRGAGMTLPVQQGVSMPSKSPFTDDWTREQNEDEPAKAVVVSNDDIGSASQAQRIADLTQANTQMHTAMIDMREEMKLLKDMLCGLRTEINAAPNRTITVSKTYQEWLNKLNLD